MITGASLVIFGTFTIFDPIFRRRFGWQINFGEYHYIYGLLIMAIGIIILYGTFKKKIDSGR